MFNAKVNLLIREVENVKSTTQFLSSIESPIDSLTQAGIIVDGANVTLARWKIFTHCAAITRLYALYEGFVLDLVTDWISRLPEFYPQYTTLPDQVQTAHRLGVSEILSKLSIGSKMKERFPHLTEASVVDGLSRATGYRVPTRFLRKLLYWITTI